ncbi:MAG: aspartate aminotransferase family protein, partial [SAR116 cluster bacterium]|nr:aspartate aminotransferase family protein [SAR116 cluster bacterium]
VEYHLHSYTHPKTLSDDGPHILTKGDGIHVYDETGKKFIEGMSGLWCASLGFSEKEIINTITDQLNKLPFYHSFAGKTADPAIRLAEHLVKISPVPMSKVFFANSGSEANDTAIKMIWYYNLARGLPEKRKIISRRKGYHGVTLAAASLTGLPYAQNGFSLPLDFVHHTMAPDFFNESLKDEDEVSFSDRLSNELEKLIIKEGPETIAAFFAEPVMGAGGVIIPPEKYFSKIQKVLKKYDILMVADEVICGFGRTGNMWGSETFNIKPDILTAAKALSSAYLPISAVILSEKVYQPIKDQANELGIFGHGYTYSAHPVCAAAALKTQQLMVERDIIGNVRNQSKLFHDRINKIKSNNWFLNNSRSVGLIGAVEFGYEGSKKFDVKEKIAAKCAKIIQENGVILRALPGDIIGFCPPLIINQSQLNEMFDKIEEAIKDFDQTAYSLK